MDEKLKSLIQIFNDAQRKAVDTLEKDFECPRPKTIQDYIGRCVGSIRDKDYESNGCRIRPHGYGMSVSFKDGTNIDFDLGEKGEINGFDPWRLYEFVRVNNIRTELNTEEKIVSAVEGAVKDGVLVKSSYINYYVVV